MTRRERLEAKLERHREWASGRKATADSLLAQKERIKTIQNQAAVREHAAHAGGVLIVGEGYVRLVFSEKPAREVLDALKSAGFQWGSGAWHDSLAQIPACLTVELVNTDGNAFAILGRVQAALRKAGVSRKEHQAFLADATAGDYAHLLAVVCATVHTA